MAMKPKDLDRLERMAREMLMIAEKGRIEPVRMRQGSSMAVDEGTTKRRGRPSKVEQFRKSLAPAEQRVFESLLKGLSAGDMARDANRSVSTITNQTARIFKALGVHSRKEQSRYRNKGYRTRTKPLVTRLLSSLTIRDIRTAVPHELTALVARRAIAVSGRASRTASSVDTRGVGT